MELLIYMATIFATAAAVVSLSYVWYGALRHALSGRHEGAGAGWGRGPSVLLLALGWPGALIYWLRVNRNCR